MPEVIYWVLAYMAIGAAWTAVDTLYGMIVGDVCFEGAVRGGLVWPFTITLIVILGLVGTLVWTARFISRCRRKDPKANA